jgi:hypothetical protein
MSVQGTLPVILDGLWHTVCRTPITCRNVMRFPELGIVESVPFCEKCDRFVPVKELA